MIIMKACWCTLAGTEHCLYCSNNGLNLNNIGYDEKYWKQFWRKRPVRSYTYTTITTNGVKMSLERDKKLIKEFCEFMGIDGPIMEIMIDEFVEEIFEDR